MALVLKDRVKVTTTTTGTGALTLSSSPVTGYQSFDVIGNGNTCYYAISSTGSAEWEVGLGTYSSSGPTLSRDTILESSAAGAAVNLSAGSKEVYVVYPAEKAIYEEADGQTLINGGPITVVGSNVTVLPTLPAELGKFVGNINSFAQIYNINQSDGAEASADFVAYNSDTDINGSTFFVDMGINSPNYNSATYPIFTPNSAYLFNDGGTLFVGSQTDDVQIFAGGANTNNVVATFGTNLSTTLEGSLDVNTTINVGGVAVFDTYVYSGANVAAAANSTVLTTKAYVDELVSSGVHFHEPVVYATAAVLPNSPTYDNGVGGVGATLTAGSNVALTIDGVTLTSPTDNGTRVLIKNQTSATQNGVYVVTEAGSGGAPWVLTRSSDTDTYEVGSSNGLSEGSTFYVTAGSTNAGSTFTCNTQGTITFGTTAITFALVSSALVYTGGTNINVSGLTISLDGTVASTNGGTGVNTVTTGDLLYGSGTNTWGKLAAGAQYKSLVMGTSTPEWNAVALDQSGAVSGALGPTNGGTGISSYTQGEMLYSNAANQLDKVTPNTTLTKKFLSQTGNGTAALAPTWAQPAASDITGLAASATTDTTNADNITSGTLNNARTTATPNNSASTIVARDASGNFAGNSISATTLSGNGASVTNLNASNISSGTIDNARTTASASNGASTIVARDASGNFAAATITAATFSGAHSGNGASLTDLNASAITTGTVDNARTTAASTNNANTIVARDASGNFSAGTITATLSGTASTAAALNTSSSYEVGSFGVGTPASGTTGEIRATNNITAYFSSDAKFKENVRPIDNALNKVTAIGGKYFDWTDAYISSKGGEDGYFVQKADFGVIAQDVQAVFPQAVRTRPDGSLAVDYEKLSALAFAAIVELKAEIDSLKGR